MLFPISAFRDRIGIAADTVFVLQKVDVFVSILLFLKLLVYPHFSLTDAAASCEHVVNSRLGYSEFVFLFFSLSVEKSKLSVFRNQVFFFIGKPGIEKNLSFDSVGNSPPVQKIFFVAGKITAVPYREQIVISTVSNALDVIENMLDVGVVKERLNEIAALFAVLVGLKKRGDLFSVVF